MGYSGADFDYRNENEGSVITSLISQLRCVLARPPPRPPHQRHQGGHGSLQGHIPHFRARAPEHARAHHRLYVPPGSHIWVRPPLLALLVVVRALTPPPMRCGAMPTYASADKCPNPEERFIRVLQYYLAGWHIKPKGVKKP